MLLCMLIKIKSLDRGDLSLMEFNRNDLLNDFGKKIVGKSVYSKSSFKYSLPWCATGDRTKIENLGILTRVGELSEGNFTKSKNCFGEMAQ